MGRVSGKVRPEIALPAPQPAAPPWTPGPSHSVAMLVTVAAISPDQARWRDARRCAERGIAALAALHHHSLMGIADPDRLSDLADWVQHRSSTDDPALAVFLEEVELRILVELAKRERG